MPQGLDDRGVSAILGTVLIMALMMTLIPGAILLKAAVSDEMAAHQEAAERAAWCARHTEIGPPYCPDEGPMPGYACAEVEVDVWMCSRLPDLSNGTNTSPTITSPVVTSPVVTSPTLGL